MFMFDDKITLYHFSWPGERVGNIVFDKDYFEQKSKEEIKKICLLILENHCRDILRIELSKQDLKLTDGEYIEYVFPVKQNCYVIDFEIWPVNYIEYANHLCDWYILKKDKENREKPEYKLKYSSGLDEFNQTYSEWKYNEWLGCDIITKTILVKERHK